MTNQAVRNELLDVLTDKPELIEPVEQAIQYERESFWTVDASMSTLRRGVRTLMCSCVDGM